MLGHYRKRIKSEGHNHATRARRGGNPHPPLIPKDICESKPVSLDSLTHPDSKDFVKNRRRVDEGMKLPILTARIDSQRQFIEKLLIKIATRKAKREALRVYAGEFRTEATSDHVASQGPRVEIPKREQGFQAGTT